MKARTALFSTGCAAALLGAMPGLSEAQEVEPTVAAFLQNTDGTTGQSPDASMHAVVSQISADVQAVHYTTDAVYVTTTGVPRYETGPFPDNNPSVAADIDTIYVVPLDPDYNDSGAPTELGLGAMGIFVNGIAIFNAEDGVTYNNQNTWHRNAILAEAAGFDGCSGHPAPLPGGGTINGFVEGIYHHHLKTQCLLDQVGDDGTQHSPIVGYAADGFPVYGPYGYEDPLDPNSAIVRVDSGYQLRSIIQRTTLPDGTVLAAAFYGPNVTTSGENRLGWFMEDFEHVDGLGDLDDHNGRFTVTPEYPAGIYAYYLTMDENGDAAFPYYLGNSFRGLLEAAIDCSGFGTEWGPGIGPPPLGCEGGPGAGGGAGIATAEEIPAEAEVYIVPEPEAVPTGLAVHATLALLLAAAALRRLRTRES